MPPRRYSRYQLGRAALDGAGRLYLMERTPYRYRPLEDTLVYRVVDGDTLWSIAARRYQGLSRPAGLWWVIADFQPMPIVDPTLQLAAGQILHVPSLRIVEEEIFSEMRRAELP